MIVNKGTKRVTISQLTKRNPSINNLDNLISKNEIFFKMGKSFKDQISIFGQDKRNRELSIEQVEAYEFAYLKIKENEPKKHPFKPHGDYHDLGRYKILQRIEKMHKAQDELNQMNDPNRNKMPMLSYHS